MNLVQLFPMWLMGCPADGVAALRYLDSLQVGHFDKEGQKLSRMRRVMRVVEHFARMRGVWKPNNANNYWNGKTVTTLWNGVWNDLKPYLLTVTSYDDGRPDSTHKSRCGEITWRTCHERFSGRRGLFRQLGIGRGS